MLAQNGQAQSMQTPWRNLTPEKMTAVWWQWAFAVPWPVNAWNDETGDLAFSRQPYCTARGGNGEASVPGRDHRKFICGNDYLW